LIILCLSGFLYIHVRNGSLEFKDAECDHIRLSPLAVFGIFIESVNVSIDPLLNLFRILSVIGGVSRGIGDGNGAGPSLFVRDI